MRGSSSAGMGRIVGRLLSMAVSKYKVTASSRISRASTAVSPCETTSNSRQSEENPTSPETITPVMTN